MKFKLHFFLLVIFALSLLAGCGSGGGTSGNGNTVFVTSGITDGEAGSVTAGFVNISTATGPLSVFAANPMSITLDSTPFTTAGSVPISPVLITGVRLSFTPLPYTSFPANSTGALSPALPNPQFANNPQGVGGVIPGPGQLQIDGIDILGDADGLLLFTSFLNSGLQFVQYNYIATLVFNGVEENSGSTLSVSQPVGVAVQFP